MTKEELKDYLVFETEDYIMDEVNGMSNTELVNAYLTYNGIIGYTEDIIEVVSAAFGIELED